MLKTRIISDRDELGSMRVPWNRLLSESPANSLFLTHEWISTWLDEVNPRGVLLVIIVEDGDELLAIAPFYISRLRLFRMFDHRCLRVLGEPHSASEYLDIIVRADREAEALQAIVGELERQRKRWDSIWIPYAATWTGARDRFRTVVRELDLFRQERELTYCVVPLPDNEDDYWASLSAKQRNNIRRYRSRIGAHGHVEVRDLVERYGLEEALSITFGLHETRRNALGQMGAFKRLPALGRFTKAFSKLAAERGWMAIFGLCRGNEAIGVRFGYVYDNRLLEIQSGYRPDINGCGIVTIDGSIRQAISRRITEYDFLAGAREYKMRFHATPKTGAKIYAGQKRPMNSVVFSAKVWPRGKYVQEELV